MRRPSHTNIKDWVYETALTRHIKAWVHDWRSHTTTTRARAHSGSHAHTHDADTPHDADTLPLGPFWPPWPSTGLLGIIFGPPMDPLFARQNPCTHNTPS